MHLLPILFILIQFNLAVAADLPDHAPANDNLLAVCGPLLDGTVIRLNADDATVLFDAGRAPRLTEVHAAIRDATEAGDQSAIAANEALSESLRAAFPRIAVSPTGEALIIDRGDDGFTVDRVDDSGTSTRVTWPLAAWLDDVHSLSPGGAYAVLTNQVGNRLRLIEVATGEVLLERAAFVRADSSGVAMRFSAGVKTMTVRRDDIVELYDLERREVIDTYDLGRAKHGLGPPPHTKRSPGINARGEIYALDSVRRLVAFFDCEMPLALRLYGAGQTMNSYFNTPPATVFTPRPSEKSAATSFEALIWREREAPHFRTDGFITASENKVFGLRRQYYAPDTESFIDLFDLKTQRYQRSWGVPFLVIGLALSRDERILAVAGPNQTGVWLFDLTKPERTPFAIIELSAGDGRALGFTSDDQLVIGSTRLSRVRRINIPAPR